MVNRILIRIKVVQMLYAYLLTRTEFKIDVQDDPGTSSDRRFASGAYTDLLMLLLELTAHNTTNLNKVSTYAIDRKLAESVVGQALASNSDIRSIVFKQSFRADVVAGLVSHLHDKIVESAAFKEFKRKRKVDLETEVELWYVLLRTTIAKDSDFLATMRDLPGFSKAGLEMAIDRTVETLRSYYGSRAGYYKALKNLETSLRKAHALYMGMFVLIVRLTEQRERQIENAKTKYLATPEDMNPNMRFVDNAFAAALARSEELQSYIKDYGIEWTNDYTLLDSLLALIMNSQIYRDYMEAPRTDWDADCEFWRQILKVVVFQSDDLVDALESESVYWNDDLHIIGTFVLKSIRVDATEGEGHLDFLPQYKDEEDSRFGAELFEFAVRNYDTYYNYIDEFVDASNWESDRIAFMDSVIMVCAIAEIINYPNIPLAVSFNEYIDIANMYSSSKSGHFINGVLYSVIEHLKKEGIITK